MQSIPNYIFVFIAGHFWDHPSDRKAEEHALFLQKQWSTGAFRGSRYIMHANILMYALNLELSQEFFFDSP